MTPTQETGERWKTRLARTGEAALGLVLAGLGWFFGLVVAGLAVAAVLAGVTFGLSLVLAVVLVILGLVALMPLVWAVWGLWEGLWLHIRVTHEEHRFALVFPFPLGWIRFIPVSVTLEGMRVSLHHLPWEDMRAALREDPVLFHMEEAETPTSILVAFGPRRHPLLEEILVSARVRHANTEGRKALFFPKNPNP